MGSKRRSITEMSKANSKTETELEDGFGPNKGWFSHKGQQTFEQTKEKGTKMRPRSLEWDRQSSRNDRALGQKNSGTGGRGLCPLYPLESGFRREGKTEVGLRRRGS